MTTTSLPAAGTPGSAEATSSVLSVEQLRAFSDAHFTARQYLPEAMPEDHLDAILHAAQRAPTDATAQMYSFIQLSDQALKQQVADLTVNPHFATAPVSFVICMDVHRLNLLLEHHGFERGEWPGVAVHFGIGDAVLAGQSMLLAAELLGYMGCWIGGVLTNLEALVDLLGLPEGVLPFAGLTIGRAAETPAQRPRIARSLVVHQNRYREPEKSELDGMQTDMAAITARGDWAQTLGRYFAKGGGMEVREVGLQKVLARQGLTPGAAGTSQTDTSAEAGA
ncbi:nitroreductase family protein [Deinococcus altitudinis]|uniref:nitroreductase family protein n=1 Tax=Deinococcus altitudinis TaxID=468914 RepID=UPI0038922583